MPMQNFLVIAIVILILGCAGLYIQKEKKKGVKCIGCPDSKTCSGHCAGCSGNCGADHHKQGH
ncbi:MAG: FeoB-associated Cys-rich membrane protein [Oscillospiraceae bacterium]|nr:FeoB-associated Cys-rich membrane protein [Oscillospiraceae bacterium]